MSSGDYLTPNEAVDNAHYGKSGVLFVAGMRVKFIADPDRAGELILDVAGADDFSWVGWIAEPKTAMGAGSLGSQFQGGKQTWTIRTRQYGGRLPMVVNSTCAKGDLLYLAAGGAVTNVAPTPATGKTINDYIVGIAMETVSTIPTEPGAYAKVSALTVMNSCYA